jgi:hypothetical protein
MSDILIPGTRVTYAADGKRTFQIPVSTTTDAAAATPAAPSGTRFVAAEYVQRPDGGRDYVFTFEAIVGGSSGTASDRQQEINGQAAQEPIETHPLFNSEIAGGGVVTQADMAEIRRAISAGTAPTFTGTGSALGAAEGLYALMLKGVTHYYTLSGVTYSETTEESTKPSLEELCTINRPPVDAPSLPTGSNWLMIGMRASKVVNPDGGNFWRVTREWLASGVRGWNADYDIYSY